MAIQAQGSFQEWALVLLVTLVPGALLAAVAMLRGYSISIWRPHRDKRRKDSDEESSMEG
jgi:hypothetical protein